MFRGISSSRTISDGVVTANGIDVMLIAENTSETVAGSVTGLTLPQAGSVPDGDFQVPGLAMTIKKAGSGNMKLFWGNSCVENDTDFAFYEGTLGVPGSHRPVVCSTGGAQATQVPPGPDDHYYLVVPLSPDGVEGSYGTNSQGEQRPQGSPLSGEPVESTTCMPQAVAVNCGT